MMVPPRVNHAFRCRPISSVRGSGGGGLPPPGIMAANTRAEPETGGKQERAYAYSSTFRDGRGSWPIMEATASDPPTEPLLMSAKK